MIRTIWIVLCVGCITLVLSEATAVALLWSQGLLTAGRLREMRDLLGPQEKESAAATSEALPILPSSQDVLRDRSLRVLSLNSLETEVALLKTMLDTERSSLSAQTGEFDKQKEAFKTQLQQLADATSVAAREQARSVLQAMPPGDAVERLMQLKSADEDVVLLREMPESRIAAILRELAPAAEGGEPANTTAEAKERRKRAKEIFDKIMNGEPRESIIRNALDNLQQSQVERPVSASAK